MSECYQNCQSCQENCQERTIEKLATNSQNQIKKVIGVVSGKGGVGKSMLTSLLASRLAKLNYRVGIMDADVTGPSIPKSFGVKEKAMASNNLLLPCKSKNAISIMSANLLLENDDEPIIWRGSMVSGLIQQFYQDVLWEELDFLLIDMPPGTGDVALTIFQKIPLDGLIIVTTPQELVSMIVKKAIKMANMLGIKIYGLIENMSYLECHNCQEKIFLYGESNLEAISREYDLPILGRIPLNRELANAVDRGEIELFDCEYLQKAIDSIK